MTLFKVKALGPFYYSQLQECTFTEKWIAMKVIDSLLKRDFVVELHVIEETS